MPSRVIVAFIYTKQMDGDFTFNPFNLRNLEIKELSLKVASRPSPYSAPLEFDFSADDYIEGYMGLFRNIREAPNDITYNDYKNGNTVFAFDLTPDLCDGDFLNISKDGSLQLSITLKKSIDESITAIFYLEFDNLIEINENRKVSYDYKV